MHINWYPGHMTKARRDVESSLKLIDIAIEIVDARAPKASRNPEFESLIGSREHIIVLNKADLADDKKINEWAKYYKSKGFGVIKYVAIRTGAKEQMINSINTICASLINRYKARGINKVLRIMVLGIPNSGKSTFINSMAGLAKTKTGDKPGVTIGKQWVKITPYLELLDTPGMLWPKLEDQNLAKHLAYVGSIKDDILDIEELALEFIADMKEMYPEALMERYKLTELNENNYICLTDIAKKRGFKLSKDEWDTARAAKALLGDFRAGKLGKITLESVTYEQEDN